MRLASKISLILLVAPTLVFASSDVFVICNSSITIKPSDLKEIFSGNQLSQGSINLVPIDNSNAEEDFAQKVMNMNKGKYEANWQKKSFREGISPPTSKSNDLDVIAAVKNNPGGIGYVSNPPGDGVRLIQKY